MPDMIDPAGISTKNINFDHGDAKWWHGTWSILEPGHYLSLLVIIDLMRPCSIQLRKKITEISTVKLIENDTFEIDGHISQLSIC